MNKKAYLLLASLFLLCSCNSKDEIDYEVVTILPLYEQIYDRCADDTAIGFPVGVSHESDLPIAAASLLADKLDNVNYSNENNFKNRVIDKDVFASLGPNQVIILQSHGEHDQYLHSSIITGGHFNETSENEDDVNEGRIIESNMFDSDVAKNYEAITCYYVDEYCPDITGSIVYLGECFACYDYALPLSFINKGATAVIGSTVDVQMHYGDMMQYTIISLLGDINPLTNNYYTLKEALTKAQNLYGLTDRVLYEGSSNDAQIIIYGDPNIRLKNK